MPDLKQNTLPTFNIKEIFSGKRILFFLLFMALVLVGKQINFSPLVGTENQFFTLFQFFGPIAGAILGPVVGVLSVAFSQVADVFIMGKEANALTLLRMLPMLFAAFYFGTKGMGIKGIRMNGKPLLKVISSSKNALFSIAVPLLCILAFVAHPVGRTVWFFSLFWLIPILGKLLPENIPGSLIFRSLGATFTAHAVGGAIWVWTVPMTAEAWIGLIPIVAYERILFALGIAGSYLVFNSTLDYVVEKWKLSTPLFLERKYSIIKFFSTKPF